MLNQNKYSYSPILYTASSKNRILFLQEYKSQKILILKSTLDKISAIDSPAFTINLLCNPNEDQPEYLIEITTTYYIGLIKIDDYLRIVISPKISHANFIAMLKYIEPERVDSWKLLFEGIEKEDNFIDLFIKHFLESVSDLLESNYRKGYSLYQEDRIAPKGRINFRNSIKNLNKYPHRLNCKYFKFNLDTPHNQIIKYTLSYIKAVISPNLFKKYQNLLRKLNTVQFRKWTVFEIRNLHYSRLDVQYRPIHQMCIMILDDFSLLFSDGISCFFTFLINSWNIFERFLLKIFEMFQSEYQVDSYNLDEIAGTYDKDIYRERPDIILSKDNSPKIIIDAKYKFFTNNRKDKHQLNWYLGRFNLQIGFLIYPMGKKSLNRPVIFKSRPETYIQHGKQICIFLVELDLSCVPDESKLKLFINKILELYSEKHKKITQGII